MKIATTPIFCGLTRPSDWQLVTEIMRRLHEALATRDRDTWVDWEDIPH